MQSPFPEGMDLTYFVLFFVFGVFSLLVVFCFQTKQDQQNKNTNKIVMQSPTPGGHGSETYLFVVFVFFWFQSKARRASTRQDGQTPTCRQCRPYDGTNSACSAPRHRDAKERETPTRQNLRGTCSFFLLQNTRFSFFIFPKELKNIFPWKQKKPSLCSLRKTTKGIHLPSLKQKVLLLCLKTKKENPFLFCLKTNNFSFLSFRTKRKFIVL